MRRYPTSSRQALFLITGMILVLMYGLGSHEVVTAAYHGRSLPVLNRMMEYSAVHPVQFYLNKSDNFVLYLVVLWLGTALAWALAARRLAQPQARPEPAQDAVMFMFCLAAFYAFLVRYGYEREWYPLEKIMAFEGNPPFHHRVMFVLPARALQALLPSLNYVSCFLWSQVLAAALALWAVKRFASLFIRADLAFIAQLLMLAVWAPTQRYYTFYDIGILFVFAFCLYHLLRQEFLPYLLMLALGTFNHETTLFLVVISALLFYRRMRLPRLARFLLLQLVLYGLVRAFLFYCLPANTAWEGGKIPYNIFLLTQRRHELLLNLGPILAWFALAAIGLRAAPPALRRCLVLLPCLAVMTFLVGQFHESRQFDAFIPVAVALMMAALARHWRAPAEPVPLLAPAAARARPALAGQAPA